MASIHRRVTSSGETRWDVRYRDPNRVDRSKSFRRKSEAARFAASVEADIDRGEWLDPTLGRESFGYWAEQWLVTTYGSHSLWTGVDDGGLQWNREPAVLGWVEGRVRPRTPLGDLRIRRLGVRVAPGAPPKSL